MTYAIEQIVRGLKQARESKGLSQRQLAKMVNIPQSHISKIESNLVDLRVSSLVEIARALDMEIAVVPRKAIPAINSIARSTQSAATNSAVTSVAKELERFQHTINQLSRQQLPAKEIAQIQRRVQDLKRLELPSSSLKAIKEASSDLRAFMRNNENVYALKKALNEMQALRSAMAHAAANVRPLDKPRPAYSLEVDDHG